MENDYAVIIGLQNYPGIDDPENGKPALAGPENDANDFRDWIASEQGGNVPGQNIRLILSSQFAAVTRDQFTNAKPTDLEITDAFDTLRRISLEKQKMHLGSKVGRRLYIFMSGHGIAPTTFGNKTEKEASLLMSNADITNITAPHYNIPGGYTAAWFCENDCFEEVFLFMDCCRDFTLISSPNWFLPNKGNSQTAKRFFAFATRWSLRSREKLIDGRMQGIFTKTLLLGLNGACAEPDPLNAGQGVITVASLKSYLYQNMRKFIDPQFAADAYLQEPDIEYYPKANDGKDIVIIQAQLQKFRLVVAVPATATGDLIIVDDKLSEVIRSKVTNPPQEFTYDLPRGTYLITCTINNSATTTRFEITGLETVGQEKRISL